MTMTVTVLGATGKTGGTAAERLLAAGVKVRAVGRSADKLAALKKRGADVVAADVGDAAALTEALRGSDAAYLMIPGDYTKPDLLGQYARAAEAIARAVQDAGVRRAVFLSSLGGEVAAGTGPIAGLHGAEKRLRAVASNGIDLLILRPGYFYENNYGTLALIKQQGINGGAIEPGVKMSTIAAADVGAAAADALRASDFSGVVVRELIGPRDLTMPEVTGVIGKAIGKPDLPYIRFPDDGYVAGLEGAGFDPGAARLFLEMAQAFNKGIVAPQEGNQKVRTATSFEAFADGFAHAYRAAP
jgi:uncharacterized protein YbjT (DUF2867 family)